MKLHFTYHAQSQALARFIHESRVADTIRRPDFTESAAGDTTLYRKRFENGILEVICRKIGKNQNEYLVLTVYFL